MWLDAIGLSFFCVVGAGKGLVAGPFIAVVMAVITASFGGIIRDVIGGESPFLLRREIYVTAALAGAVTFVGGVGAGLPEAVAAIAGFAVCLVIRGLGLIYGLSLPTYRARPGRSVGARARPESPALDSLVLHHPARRSGVGAS